MALAEWLVNVGGSTTQGQLTINQGKKTLTSVNMPAAQRWIYSTAESSVQYFTANTPVSAPADALCGRVVFSDIHVSAPNGFKPGLFPSQCGAVGDLSPQEKALEFMLFDLSSCIQEDQAPPRVP
jgi:FlaG/FlaF family flagellin (archaellin)